MKPCMESHLAKLLETKGKKHEIEKERRLKL